MNNMTNNSVKLADIIVEFKFEQLFVPENIDEIMKNMLQNLML